MNFLNVTVKNLHKKLSNKNLSVEDLIKATFDNIKETDNKYEAFITLMEEQALFKAKKLDESDTLSNHLLTGIPFGIKDNIVTKDVQTTAASRILKDFKPIYNATVINNLNQFGAIGVGKLNLDEFAMGSTTETSYYKKTKNAWDQSKIPGGSSGGSAVSVASGQVPFALGSDTGGSIRQPAAFNGIVGLKPTYGRVSRWGLIAFASSLDQIGPLTRTVEDNALVLNAIAGYDSNDQTSSKQKIPDFTAGLTGDIKGMKIAIPKEYFGDGVDSRVAKVVKSGISQLEVLGAKVEEVSLPHTKYGVAAYYILSSSEASSNLQRFDGIRYGFRDENVKTLEDLYVQTRTKGFGNEVKRRIMLGTYSLSAGSYDRYFKKAAQVRTLISNEFKEVFAQYDLIVAPTTPNVAYGFGENKDDPQISYMNDALTIPTNLAGLPGISINAGFIDGLPVGMQLIGNRFEEAKIYQAAYAFEQAMNLFEKIPGGVN